MDDKVADYVLVEDVQSGWEKKDQEKASCQRILDVGEKVLAAQNKWKGAGKFILRRLSDVSSINSLYTHSKNISCTLLLDRNFIRNCQLSLNGKLK